MPRVLYVFVCVSVCVCVCKTAEVLERQLQDNNNCVTVMIEKWKNCTDDDTLCMNVSMYKIIYIYFGFVVIIILI